MQLNWKYYLSWSIKHGKRRKCFFTCIFSFFPLCVQKLIFSGSLKYQNGIILCVYCLWYCNIVFVLPGFKISFFVHIVCVTLYSILPAFYKIKRILSKVYHQLSSWFALLPGYAKSKPPDSSQTLELDVCSVGRYSLLNYFHTWTQCSCRVKTFEGQW